MNTDSVLDDISKGLSQARTRLDDLRRKAKLLTVEARDKKSAIISDLERRYDEVKVHLHESDLERRFDEVKVHLHEAASATGEQAGTAKRAAEDAWNAFRDGLEAVADTKATSSSTKR